MLSGQDKEADDEKLKLRLELEAEGYESEDSAVERVRQLELPDERSLNSQADLYIEDADPVGIGQGCQVDKLPKLRQLPCQTVPKDRQLFNPDRIDSNLLDLYLRDIYNMWPQDFDYREEIALQFLHERLNYRVTGYT